MQKSDAFKMALKFYRGEINDSYTYQYLARLEKDKKRKRMLIGLANIEKRHADFWKNYLERRNTEIPEAKFGGVKKFAVWLTRKFLGVRVTVSLSEMGESSAIESYYEFYEHGDLSEEERKKLKLIILDELEHEKFFLNEKKILHTENIRDMVLGMNDGLVEILGAVTGLSAVYYNNPLLVGLSGLIVGVAGSLSMGIGAYVSVRSQRQVNEGSRRKLKIILDISKRRVTEEIKTRLVDLGASDKDARELAEKMSLDGGVVNKLVPEEKVNEKRAAVYTGLAYILGVFFPVVPYFFAPNTAIALPLSIVFAGLALSIVSAIISVMSGISAKKKVTEMIVLGLGAAALSYGFGTFVNLFFGTSI